MGTEADVVSAAIANVAAAAFLLKQQKQTNRMQQQIDKSKPNFSPSGLKLIKH